MSGPRTAPARSLASTLFAGALTLAAAGCSGTGASESDSAAYDNEEAVAAMVEAVAEQDAVRLTLGTRQSPADITVDSSWAGDEPVLRALTGGDPAQQLDVRRVGSRVYVGGELVGHQWTYLEIDDPRLADPDSGFDAGPVPALLAIDVPGDLAALESAVTEASDKGTQEIDGQATDRYALTVETKEWFAGLDESSMYRAMDLPATVTMDLYVDDASLPVRLAYQVPDEPQQSAEIGFSEWGTPVEVSVPRRAKPLS